jgi:hypothetical protein
MLKFGPCWRNREGQLLRKFCAASTRPVLANCSLSRHPSFGPKADFQFPQKQTSNHTAEIGVYAMLVRKVQRSLPTVAGRTAVVNGP